MRLNAGICFVRGQDEGHPLERSGQADKGNPPRCFHQVLTLHQPYLFVYLNGHVNLRTGMRTLETIVSK
jgi:hypothetical protein